MIAYVPVLNMPTHAYTGNHRSVYAKKLKSKKYFDLLIDQLGEEVRTPSQIDLCPYVLILHIVQIAFWKIIFECLFQRYNGVLPIMGNEPNKIRLTELIRCSTEVKKKDCKIAFKAY